MVLAPSQGRTLLVGTEKSLKGAGHTSADCHCPCRTLCSFAVLDKKGTKKQFRAEGNVTGWLCLPCGDVRVWFDSDAATMVTVVVH